MIRNVQLFDTEEDTGDTVLVSILIKNKKLDVVTKDEISGPEGTLVLDAQNGVLMGKLHIGDPPSFMIFGEDPRKNVEVILDTKTHAHFAVHEGEILKNTLRVVTDVEEQPKKTGWLAYTPPPMALPTSYQDNTKWNKWDTKYISGIFLAAVVLDRQRWVSQDDSSEQQVGDVRLFDGGEIRGLRFGAIGTLNFKRPWVYTVFAATNAFDKGFDTDQDDDFSFFDYRLDIPLRDGTNVSIGKQKEPISMERIMGMIYLPMQERAAVSDALLPSRNFGVVLSGTGFEQRMTWAGGAFNDSITHGDSFNDSASQIVGRMTWLPFLSEDESNLLHLGVGVRFSDAKEGFLAQTEPEFNKAPIFVDTAPPSMTPSPGIQAANDTSLYNLELSWRKGPFWVAAEYLISQVDAPDLGDPVFAGSHITGAWALGGEMRPYHKKSGIFRSLPVTRSVYQGGWGTWELALRWSDVDLTDGTIAGGEMEIYSGGINWWLSPIFNVSLNYRYIDLDRFGVDGQSHGFNARVLLVLE